MNHLESQASLFEKGLQSFKSARPVDWTTDDIPNLAQHCKSLITNFRAYVDDQSRLNNLDSPVENCEDINNISTDSTSEFPNGQVQFNQLLLRLKRETIDAIETREKHLNRQ